MAIPDPLRSYMYETGGLIQRCTECDWALRGHKREYLECPACGGEIDPDVIIEFGGTAIEYRSIKGDFYIYTQFDRLCVRLQAADLPEIIQFFCRHARDSRMGRVRPGMPHRIENRGFVASSIHWMCPKKIPAPNVIARESDDT